MKNGEWKMENGKETVADVLEKMSECAKMRDFDSDGMLSTSILRVFADHLQAAYGREVAELRAKAESAELYAALWEGSAKAAEEKLRELRSATLGNAAKMRKAVCDLMDEYVHRKCPPEKNCEGCERKCGINDAWLAVLAALKEPPRNCDKYETEDDAVAAYENGSGDMSNGRALCWWLYYAEGGASAGECARIEAAEKRT